MFKELRYSSKYILWERETVRLLVIIYRSIIGGSFVTIEIRSVGSNPHINLYELYTCKHTLFNCGVR
jgi:hypothetical protein